MNTPPKDLLVPAGSTATLAVLVRAALGLSHQKAKDLVASGRVAVDGVPAHDPAQRPAPGAVVSVGARPGAAAGGAAGAGSPGSAAGPAPARRRLEGPGFRVVHLDDRFVVVDKDPGIVTVPTSKETPHDPPLVARVLATMAQAGHRVRSGLFVVHRIDRNTSGLVLFARSEEASDALRAEFRARRPLREYLAWTEGIPDPAAGTLQHNLRESERTRRVFATRSAEGARAAELTYEVEAQSVEPRRARVRVRLVTGRRNQIRVQFSNCGWPLLGDHFYGATDEGPGRTALHAARLGFADPGTGAPLVFESPLPEDLARLDRRLFGRQALQLRRAKKNA